MPYVEGYMKVRIWVREGAPVTPDPGPVDPGYGVELPIGPEHPIVLPPSGNVPGVPTHPIELPPYPDQGLPVEPPSPSHPIELPPDGTIGGTPEHPIYFPPVEPGVPAHPIELPPGGTIGGTPEHPIYLPDPGTPEHPIELPAPLPMVNPDGAGDHPLVPDLNSGYWAQCSAPKGIIFTAFVAYEPGEDRDEPDSKDLPGTWVTVLAGNDVVWAWVQEDSVPPHVEPRAEKSSSKK